MLSSNAAWGVPSPCRIQELDRAEVVARDLTHEFEGCLRNHRYLSSWIGRRSLPRPSETRSSERVSSLCDVRQGRRPVMTTLSVLSAR
jgi:hypothetical protein